MAFTEQEWTLYDWEHNPDGVGVDYNNTTGLDHLKEWFAGTTGAAYNGAQWTISAQDTNWIELKPPASAINPDDRLLLFVGATPNSGAMADPGFTPSSSHWYMCYAPNAGTTGPDNDPITGNPYLGVISTKLHVARTTLQSSSMEGMQIAMSNDAIFIHHSRLTGTSTIATCQGMLLAGRLFVPFETEDQLPLSYGMGSSADPDWSETFTESGLFPNPIAALDAGDGICYVQQLPGNVAWTMCERTNCWRRNGYRRPGNRRLYFDIELGERTFAAAGQEFIGTIRAIKGGAATLHGQTISDVTGKRGISISTNFTQSTNGTFYLWDE